MTVGFGRLIRSAGAGAASCYGSRPVGSTTFAVGRLIKSAEVDAHQHAGQIIAEARLEAARIVNEARSLAAEQHLIVQSEARAVAIADFIQHSLRLAKRDARSDQEQLDRVMTLATLLAERVLGETLSVEPKRIVAIAREVLLEVQGAEKIVMAAHPEDARVLQESLAKVDGAMNACHVSVDPSLARGHLRIETDLGTVEAALGERLEKLARSIKETLTP